MYNGRRGGGRRNNPERDPAAAAAVYFLRSRFTCSGSYQLSRHVIFKSFGGMIK
jgi:hypothetical protein